MVGANPIITGGEILGSGEGDKFTTLKNFFTDAQNGPLLENGNLKREGTLKN